MRKTKIICTIGPASENEETLKKMCLAGMNVARLNFSHGTHEEQQKKIDLIKKVRTELNLPIAILLDTKGPEYRIRTFKDGKVHVNAGDKFTFTVDEVEGDEKRVSVNYKGLVKDLSVGDKILVNNGLVVFEVEELKDSNANCVCLVGGDLSNRKSMSFPNKVMTGPFLSDADKQDLLFGIQNGVDFVAASFVSNKQNVLDMRAFLDENGGADIEIIAKIENQSGVDNAEEILEACGGLMVARGDLGVEVPFVELPAIQKRLIHKCRLLGKRVVTATEMLESMIQNPRPTRAEVTDIANAIYQHTDALMLSGETAYGKYPVEAVATMARVAEEAENNKLTENNIRVVSTDDPDVTSFLAKQAVKTFNKLGTKAIVTDSYTGRTARYVAAFRGRYPVLAICYYERTIRLLALSYGVFPLYQERTRTSREYLFNGLNHLMEQHLINRDDLIAYLGGGFGEGKGTTFLEINRVGEVLDNFDHYTLPNMEDTEA